MFYDLIIVSQSRKELIPITQQCIDTARRDTEDINVIVVETGQPYLYSGMDKQVLYNGEFCYNRALNLGLKYAKGDVHIMANNDIIFQPGWSKIGELMKINDIHSASAKSGHLTMFPDGDHIYEGYRVGYIFTGWCLFADRYCIKKIGRLDESVSFWYSDDLYALQLQAEGIRHALFCNIHIDHMCSKTLQKQPSNVQRKYQMGELHKFVIRKKYYDKNRRTINA